MYQPLNFSCAKFIFSRKIGKSCRKDREMTEGGVGKSWRGVGRMYTWNLIAQKRVTAVYKATE